MDEELTTLAAARDVAKTPVRGWLRAARQARGVTQQQLATKLGFARQAWAQLEISEVRGAISLYSLRRAADALGYDLVYFLVPRDDSARKTGLSPSDQGEEVAAAKRWEVGGRWNEGELPTELR